MMRDANADPGTGEGSGAIEAGPSETQQFTQQKTDQRQGMLAVNDLNYILAPDLSVSVNNTHKNHFFQSQTYENTQRAICILNSGADYGDTRCSHLNFSVKLNTTNNDWVAYFGKHGSVLNLIKTLTITSRSGDEISRVTDLNHLSVATNPFRYSKNWFDTVGGNIGYGAFLLPQGSTKNGVARFSIPLYLLSDFFAYGRLLPAMVLAGLRIEIEWEHPDFALQTVHAKNSTKATTQIITSYTIQDLYIALRSVQLTDGTQRALNEMSSVNGLEIVYCDHERTEQSFSGAGSGTYQLEVRKAATRALKAYLCMRPINSVNLAQDSFRTEDYTYTSWQWQLGSLYFPQQPIKTPNSATPELGAPESYAHALQCFNTYKGDQDRTSLVTLRGSTTEATLSDATLPVTFTLDGNGTATAFAANVSIQNFVYPGQVLATFDATLFNTLGSGGTIDYGLYGGMVVRVLTVSDEVKDVNQTFTYEAKEAKTATNTTFIDITNNSFYYDAKNSPWWQPNRRTQYVGNVYGKDGSYISGRSTICCLLERSDLFNLTGVPINNSRVLSVRVETPSAKDRILTIFLKYVRLARVFLNNVEVEQ